MSGAVAGATFDLIVGSAVATGGASIPFLIGAGAISGAAGSITEQVWDLSSGQADAMNWKKTALSAAFGGLLGPLGAPASKWVHLASKASAGDLVLIEMGEELAQQTVAIHHIATHNNKTWTPVFAKIAAKYGLKLDQQWNKISISVVSHFQSTPKHIMNLLSGHECCGCDCRRRRFKIYSSL